MIFAFKITTEKTAKKKYRGSFGRVRLVYYTIAGKTDRGFFCTVYITKTKRRPDRQIAIHTPAVDWLSQIV